MGTRRSRLRPLSLLALLVLGALLLGCGDSGSSDGNTGAGVTENAQEAREAEEELEVRAELKELKGKGLVVDCGSQVFANKRSICGFAKNMRHAYYTEVIGGSGKAIGLDPRAGKDFRVYCSGTVPHRCTGFKDDGLGIESLDGALIFFSP
jgi:hypothetical protein